MAVSENILTNLRLPARADARMVNSTSSQVKYYRAVFFKAFVRRRTMNARIILLSLAIIGLALSGCEKSIDATEENGLAKEGITNDLLPIIFAPVDSSDVYYDNLPKDTVTILSGEIQDSTLKLEVEYLNGCGEHTFILLVSTEQYYSNPPQRVVYLGHDAGNDSCKAKINDLLLFNLQPWRERLRYRSDGSTRSGIVVVRLHGLHDDYYPWLGDKSMWLYY